MPILVILSLVGRFWLENIYLTSFFSKNPKELKKKTNVMLQVTFLLSFLCFFLGNDADVDFLSVYEWCFFMDMWDRVHRKC